MAPPPRKPRQPGPHHGTDAASEGSSSNSSDNEAYSRSDQDFDDDVIEEELNNPDNISSLVPDLPDAAAKKSKWDRPRQKMLTSNSWRYGDEAGGEEEDERLMDEVQLEQLGFERGQRQIEQEELALARNVKFDPREIDLNKPFQSAVGPMSNNKSKKKRNRHSDGKDEVYSGDQDADLSEFLVADEADPAAGATMTAATTAVVKPTKGNIHKLEDKTEFYKLQQEIEKSKAAKEIERKFGASSNKLSGNKNSSSGKKKNAMMADEQNIDDFLSSIDGLSVSNKSKTTAVDADELDELLAAATSGNTTTNPAFSTTTAQTTRKGEPSGEKISLFAGSQVQKQPAQKAVQYNEAWLDNLLN
ncbi:hypothetical protein D0Z00_001474 [Geotrichum galactomycetum]|uniref:Uncharacterized protein n=1 Tax=Geotrichum galactomycetum TaxID=27317 RepID=A0ACB6V743_9ASCO|nr:hypothetical protein D0Z00_001474 [Geotrichum candidum]